MWFFSSDKPTHTLDIGYKSNTGIPRYMHWLIGDLTFLQCWFLRVKVSKFVFICVLLNKNYYIWPNFRTYVGQQITRETCMTIVNVYIWDHLYCDPKYFMGRSCWAIFSNPCRALKHLYAIKMRMLFSIKNKYYIVMSFMAKYLDL